MRYTTIGLLLLALLLGAPDLARSLPATCIPLPFPTTPAGTVFTLPIFFGSGQGKLELWRQACQDGSGQTAMLVRATPFTTSVHVCSPTILQNGIQFQGRLAPGPGQSFCDSLFIPQTFILVEFSGTPQFDGAAAFSLINDGIPATRIDVPAGEPVPPPPTITAPRQLLNVGTFVGPTVPPTPQQQQQTFRATDSILAGATYYDPAEACVGVPPAAVKFFVFTLEGQLVLGRNRATGGVSSTQIGTSKYQALLTTLEPGALPPGAYNAVFWVKDCTDTYVLVSEFAALQVLGP